jgi:hypothetical protein
MSKGKMEINSYHTINDLILEKHTCPFCKHILHPNLTNLFTGENFTNFKSNFIDNQFEFSLNYNSYSAKINTKGSIDPVTNKLSFPFSKGITSEIVADVLELIGIHIQLDCVNKDCNNNYYICSNNFIYDTSTDLKIKSFSLYYDAYNVKKYWVQNDWAYNVTNIVKDQELIQVPILNLNNLTLNQLESKIKTIVNLS